MTNLGRTGLSVSRLCLGTMSFGWKTDEPTSHQIMDRAHELGINFFDTANVYGWGEYKGRTEEILGTWFAQGGDRRDKTVLATKLYGDMGEWPNQRGCSALNIRKAVEASLKRLQTDYIDLIQMHHIDRATPWDEVWEAFETLIRQGKVVYVGSSNFAGWHLAASNEAARRRGTLGLVSEQPHYNLFNRMPELDLLPACEHYGVGVIPWSPLAGGLLGGVLDGGDGDRRKSEDMVARIETERPRLEAWEGLCKDLGERPADVALAWLLTRPAVTGPIIGPRTQEQLEGATRAVEIQLTAETLAKLDELFPGYKPAPEHFAW